jgi:murein DD-endopeptidase MepM/ murein hydrolase activator NlpD
MRKLVGAVTGTAAAGIVAAALLFSPEAPPPPESPQIQTQDAFGIVSGAYETVRRTVRRNETLSDLLSPFNVPAEAITRLASEARPLFDVRRIRPGRELVVYHADDSLRTARLAVYEEDAVSYVVFDLRDSVSVRRGTRPVQTVVRTVSGTVDGSLYESLQQHEANALLANRLSEVYAWQIDFYRLQKGDSYTVAFEERFVDQQPIGIGRVLSAHFRHAGREFKAYLYDREGGAEYFDEEGNSLRKAFLAAPVEYSRISSRYNPRRFHPVQKRYKAHLGTDYAAPYGTPIRATGDGVVVEASYTSGNGRYVKIRHNGTYTTQYLHMSRIANGMRPGVAVRQGQVIGFVGSTGLATGNHVCYRFWKNGRQVDPLREEFPSVEPLPESDMPAFTQARGLWERHFEAPDTRVGPAVAVVASP